jgi:hypothetical protein
MFGISSFLPFYLKNMSLVVVDVEADSSIPRKYLPVCFGAIVFSRRRIGDLYSGLTKDYFAGSKRKKFRKTSHTHNPVDDASGNAEALLVIRDLGLKFPF